MDTHKMLPDGTQQWYYNGELHCDHLPAVLRRDGSCYWYRHGVLHREEDLPAVMEANGMHCWFRNGELYQDNLPEETNYMHDSMEDRQKRLECYAQFVLIERGVKMWYQYGKQHRDGDQPAVTYPDGTQEWWWLGKLHRDNGPAVINADGTQDWWRHGKRALGPSVSKN